MNKIGVHKVTVAPYWNH